jgi:hypothetical protein
MSYANPIWLEGRRKYWTRPDAYRFAPPGSPEAKMPGWLDPWATRVRAKEAAEEAARAQADAEQEELERELAELRDANARVGIMLADVKFELALRALGQKYSQSQQRVPAGSPEGGQWTSGATAIGDAAAPDSSFGGAGGNGVDVPDDNNSLAQDRLLRTPASDQPPRGDRRQLEAIANDPLIHAYMNEAWMASNPYGLFPKEHGFWISRDEVSGQLFTRPFSSPGFENKIDPGSPPPDAIAFFHTHPYGGIQIGAAPPSPGDEGFAAKVGLPGLIQSHVGMYYFGPPLRPVR